MDMSEFEAQFNAERISPFMDNVMHERMADIRDRMADLEGVISYKSEFVSFVLSRLTDLRTFESSLREMLREIENQRYPLNREKRDLESDMAKDKREMESLARELVRIMAELDAQRKLKEERDEIDISTSDAPWRQFAKKHQFEGAYRLSSARKAILGDAPGLGKTIQAIMTIDMLRGLGMARKTLIFCPKPVLDGFETQFGRWTKGHFVWVLNQSKKGLKEDVLDIVERMPEAVILTNYEVWRKNKAILQRLIGCHFDTVILDEAHVLKNSKSVTAQGILEIVKAENKCFNCNGRTFGSACPSCGMRPTELFQNRSVQNVFPMTGTPILNRPQDLFTMLHIIDDIGFPDEQSFLWDFCVQVWNAEGTRKIWKFTQGGEKALLKKLGMKYTARTRESAGVEMPPQEIKHHWLELDEEKYPRQYKFIQELKHEAKIAFGDGKSLTQFETFAWYTRMRQSAIWPDGIIIRDNRKDPITGEEIGTGEIIWPRPGHEKEDLPGESILMDEGEEIIREAVESGNRIVVFCKYKTALKEMQRRLSADGIPLVRYDADLSDDARVEAQRDFDLTITRPENSNFKVMLAQYDSAKVGLNLHGAQEVLMLDREWNPGMEKQAMDRVRRIGSEFDTIVHILHAEGTATDLIDALIAEKQQMLDGFDSEVDQAATTSMIEAMRKFLEG